MYLQRWIDLCSRLGCGNAESRFETMRAAYAEKGRYYHTFQHIAECLAVFDANADMAKHRDEVEFAIWLHDAVYRPLKSNNEERSAELAAEWLDVSNVDDESIARISALILATRHTQRPETTDEALFLDIDIHILGAPRERHDEYETQVRREYRWVPTRVFNRRRAEILQSFSDRDPLFHTDTFRERFEDTAKDNLKRAIQELHGRASRAAL